MNLAVARSPRDSFSSLVLRPLGSDEEEAAHAFALMFNHGKWMEGDTLYIGPNGMPTTSIPYDWNREPEQWKYRLFADLATSPDTYIGALGADDMLRLLLKRRTAGVPFVNHGLDGLRLSAGSSVGPAYDAAKLERILANLETRGITVVRGEKAASALDNMGASAAYSPMFGKPRLYFRDGPISRGAVVEELLHHGQSLRRGFAEVTDPIALKRISYIDEIEAQQYMIDHAIRKKWTQEEVEFYRGQLRRWLDMYEAFQLEHAR